MKDKILDKCIFFLQKYNNYSKKDIQKLRYGLEGIYLTITKMIFILLLSLILGILKEVVLVFIFFNILRFFGFGFHAEKSSECLIMSTINFVLLPLLLLNVSFSTTVDLIISIFCIIIFLLFAPADTVKRPLVNKKKRITRKILTVCTGIIYLILIVIFKGHYIKTILLSSLIIQAIVVNPVTYFLAKQPYNNYKKLN